MKRDHFRRVLFVTAACLLSLPWLMPCVLGGLSAMAVRRTGRVLFGKPDSDLRFSDQVGQNQQALAFSDRALKVCENQLITRTLLITAEELQKIEGMDVSHRGLSFRERSAASFEAVASALEEADGTGSVSGRSHDVQTRDFNTVRHKVVLSSAPFVMLEADELRHVRRGKEKHPVMALAATNTGLQANATIITSGGNYFATARRIHFRGPSPEIVLEGNPVVQFGRRQVKPARLGTLMKFNFITHEVSVGGRAVESKF
jgi:hypothetical protein